MIWNGLYETQQLYSEYRQGQPYFNCTVNTDSHISINCKTISTLLVYLFFFPIQLDLIIFVELIKLTWKPRTVLDPGKSANNGFLDMVQF